MAIDIKELHIGAHISINGERVRIEQIATDYIGFKHKEGDYSGYPPDRDRIEPIPITEELLSELGFECIARYNESWWQRGNKRIKIKGNYVEVEVYQGFYDATWRCVYLHELEAFLYLTTKTELIKE